MQTDTDKKDCFENVIVEALQIGEAEEFPTFKRFQAAIIDLANDYPSEQRFLTKIADESYYLLCIRLIDGAGKNECVNIDPASAYLEQEYKVDRDWADYITKAMVNALGIHRYGPKWVQLHPIKNSSIDESDDTDEKQFIDDDSNPNKRTTIDIEQQTTDTGQEDVVEPVIQHYNGGERAFSRKKIIIVVAVAIAIAAIGVGLGVFYDDIFAKESHTFSYDLNGGNGDTSSQTVKDSETFTLHATPSYYGHTFLGYYANRSADETWYVEGHGWCKWTDIETNHYTPKLYPADAEYILGEEWTSGSPESNYVFKAQYRNNTFTVKYKANGGSGTMADTKHTYDVKTDLSLNQFKRSGYKFKGWHAYRKSDNKWAYIKDGNIQWYERNKQPEGFVLYKYPDGDWLAWTTAVDGDVITLYARWKAIPKPETEYVSTTKSPDEEKDADDDEEYIDDSDESLDEQNEAELTDEEEWFREQPTTTTAPTLPNQEPE